MGLTSTFQHMVQKPGRLTIFYTVPPRTSQLLAGSVRPERRGGGNSGRACTALPLHMHDLRHWNLYPKQGRSHASKPVPVSCTCVHMCAHTHTHTHIMGQHILHLNPAPHLHALVTKCKIKTTLALSHRPYNQMHSHK